MRLLIWLTDKAREWVKANVCYENWQVTGGCAIAIDHHYIEDIYHGMIDDGLKPGIDFRVS